MGTFQWVGGKWLKESTSEKINIHLPHLCFGKVLLRPLTFLAPWRAQSAPVDTALNSGKWWSTELLHLHSPCLGYPVRRAWRVTRCISKLAEKPKAQGCLLFKGKQLVLILVARYSEQTTWIIMRWKLVSEFGTRVIPSVQHLCGHLVLKAK